MSAATATMPRINPVTAATVLGWCDACGNVVAFTPRGLDAHARCCPGSVEADRDGERIR